MTDRTVSPEAGCRFRRAAAFLLHYREQDAEGAEEILGAIGAGEGGDWEGLMYAVAELAWRMAGTLGPEEAGAYLRGVAANAALSEVMGAVL